MINAADSAVWEYRLFSTLSSCMMIEAIEREEGKKESICMSCKLYEVKKNYKNFHDILERGWVGGRGVETKHMTTFFHEEIKQRIMSGQVKITLQSGS